MNKMHLILVYGTLKKGEPNSHIMDQREGIAIFKGKARTCDKWPLVIASKYNIPYLIYSKGIGYNVIGELYEVDDITLAAMDELEGHPTYYERELTPVQLTSSPVSGEDTLQCWIYFLKKYKPQLLELPFLEEYSSNNDQNLPYLPRYKRVAIDEYNAIHDVQQQDI